MRSLETKEIEQLKQNLKKKQAKLGISKLRTVIYARKSSEDERQTSIDTQINQCTSFINNYDFLELVGTYSEDNVSGMFTDGRTQYLKIMELAEKREIDVIVVMKLDRLARDLSDSATTIKLLEMYGTYLIAGDDVGDTTTPAGEFLRSIVLAQGQYHARRAASDVMAAECNNARKGLTSGGVAPYGLQIVSKKFEINPNEAPAVKKMFEMTKDGYSYKQISDELSGLGYFSRSGKPFSFSTINTILKNDKYYGSLVYNREGSPRKKKRVLREKFDEIRVDNAIEPIISKELFDYVQKIIEQRKTNSIPKQNTSPDYILTGLIVCGKCGKPMHGTTIKSGRNKLTKRYYVCPNHKKSKTCVTKDVNAEYLECAVKETIANFVNGYIGKTRLSAEAFKRIKSDMQESLKKLNKDYEAIDKKISSYLEQITAPSTSNVLKSRYESEAEKYLEALEIKKQRINEIKQKLKTVSKIENDFGASKRVLSKEELFSTYSKSRTLCSIFIDKIVVDDKNDNIDIVLK